MNISRCDVLLKVISGKKNETRKFGTLEVLRFDHRYATAKKILHNVLEFNNY